MDETKPILKIEFEGNTILCQRTNNPMMAEELEKRLDSKQGMGWGSIGEALNLEPRKLKREDFIWPEPKN